MTDTITITAGRPNRQGDEKDFDGENGTYTATLIGVTEPVTEKSTMVDKKGDGTWTYRDWTFAIEPDEGLIDVRANTGSTGPRSKQYGIVAALVGRTPPVGAEIDIKKHLIGRQCLVSIGTKEGTDFPEIRTFMALPPSKAAAPAEPVTEPAAAAAATGDELPF